MKVSLIEQIKDNLNENPTICIIGCTGSGKSTLCHILIGSDPRVNTDIFVNG